MRTNILLVVTLLVTLYKHNVLVDLIKRHCNSSYTFILETYAYSFTCIYNIHPPSFSDVQVLNIALFSLPDGTRFIANTSKVGTCRYKIVSFGRFELSKISPESNNVRLNILYHSLSQFQ